MDVLVECVCVVCAFAAERSVDAVVEETAEFAVAAERSVDAVVEETAEFALAEPLAGELAVAPEVEPAVALEEEPVAALEEEPVAAPATDASK